MVPSGRMTSLNSRKTGEIVALPRPGHGRVDDRGAALPVRPERPLSSLSEDPTDLGNVVPFRRPRVQDDARDAPEVVLPADAARPPGGESRERMRLAALALLSLLVHGGLLAFVWREPDPLAS